jgi:hypothetical protein
MKISKLKQIIREEYKNHQSEILLREVIRHTLLNEVKAGDFKKAVEIVKKAQKEKVGKEAFADTVSKMANHGVGIALSAIPFGSALWSTISAVKDSTEVIINAHNKLKDPEKKKNPIWDQITIDPDTSEIVDDAVEFNFLKNVSDTIENAPDDQDIDLDVMLSNYLKGKYNKHHVATD